MIPTIVFYDQFWAAIEGHAPAPAPVTNPPEPTDAYAALAGPGAKASIVTRLARALPDFRVWDGGGDRTHELVSVARPVESPGSELRG